MALLGCGYLHRLAPPQCSVEGRAMKVRLCRQCPFTVEDIAEYYDGRAEQTLCTTCPTKPLPVAPRYKWPRRRWPGKEARHGVL